MQQVLLDQFKHVNLNILVVWERIYEADTLKKAQDASELFMEDSRVSQFYDPENYCGIEVAKELGSRSNRVAWDIYLFFSGDEDWSDRMPEMLACAHQLERSSWADPSRLFKGDQLPQKLESYMRDLFPGHGAT